MATPKLPASSLTNEQLVEMLGLIKGADSVELKLTVPETDHRSAIGALDIDPLDAQVRQVVFFDTPDLTLNEHGIVVRARRIQGKGDDSTVKLRSKPNSVVFGSSSGAVSLRIVTVPQLLIGGVVARIVSL